MEVCLLFLLHHEKSIDLKYKRSAIVLYELREEGDLKGIFQDVEYEQGKVKGP